MYKSIDKISWCFQNFLTMEFYRKICNKCYWSNIYNTKHSIVKQSLILLVSFIPVLFLSFFYLPTDPANLNKSSFLLRVRNYISEFSINLISILQSISNKIIQLSSSFIDLIQIKFVHRDILEINSTLRI
ncbi:MAG TPA: hypothetical protein PKC91_10140 [Ignavibacteria bacterium]|nr:hypothetical protein [Ignavibacteria bacterium]